MYSRKEKTDASRSGHAQVDGVLELFSLLESPDPQSVESVKIVIHENLTASKDSSLLYGLVDYYMAVQSKRSLDILVRVREPHDKHLFDKLTEYMKNESTRYRSLQLLCSLVYKQPTWLYKIAQHRVISTLLSLLKNDSDAPNLMCALFIVICLLPMIPSQFGPFLPDTFEIFSRLAAWSIKKPTGTPEICVLHLQIGVYSLFHRLYGMYPCNFLAYLRSFYGGRDYNENFRVFALVIKPMLERVRLHPLLVTASKETELSANRWKKMATHDIVVDCASISLDAIEGTFEGIRGQSHTLCSMSSNQNYSFSQDSIQQVSFSSQSSSMSMTVESGSLINDSLSGNQEAIWSPSHTCGFSTPPPSSHSQSSPLAVKSECEARILSSQLSSDEKVPLDFAVEAKPELIKADQGNAVPSIKSLPRNLSNDSKSQESDTALEDSDKMELSSEQLGSNQNDAKVKIEISKLSSFDLDRNVMQAVEAKEEDIDREVSELTSCSSPAQKISQGEVRHNTPFCYTTQNLTDKPDDLSNESAANCSRSDSLTKSMEDDTDVMYTNMQETIVRTMNRYRYISLCETQQPKIIVEPVKRPKAHRSMSCPEIKSVVSRISQTENNASCESTVKLQTEVISCDNVATAANTFVPLQNSADSGIAANIRESTYEQLIPMALEPLPVPREVFELGSDQTSSINTPSLPMQRNDYFSSLSPPELLDRYLQMGSETYLNQLNSIPITSTKTTDWTHFGGQPPADEIAILRSQILLLHSQLLFERHRKEIHSERNRRILGRAKTSKMQEEQIEALKHQVSLLEKENQDLKTDAYQKLKLYNQLRIDKQLSENELNSQIFKKAQENDNLLFSNKKLQGLLVSQKQENDEIRSQCKKCQSELVDLNVELELSSREMAHCKKLERDAVWMSKQLILLQELNIHYKDKIELMKEPPLIEIGMELMKDAECAEIKDLKQKLDTKTCLFDASKSKCAELELLLSNMKLKLKEQGQVIETLKSLHEDEIAVREDRLADLTKLSIQKECHILELYQEQETLSEKIRTMERQKMKASYSDCAQSAEQKINFSQNSLQQIERPIETDNVSEGKHTSEDQE